MKATINGIEIEGTPQEIAEYQRLQAKQEAYKRPLSAQDQIKYIKAYNDAVIARMKDITIWN